MEVSLNEVLIQYGYSSAVQVPKDECVCSCSWVPWFQAPLLRLAFLRNCFSFIKPIRKIAQIKVC
jgi:hypothetical protein